MSQLHRIQWIDYQIRKDRFPNCSSIAKEFCISTRQASRDIEYLRYSLNAPIEYSQEKRGYFYSDATFTLPGILINENEKKALQILSEQYKKSKNQTALRLANLFDNLTMNNSSTDFSSKKSSSSKPFVYHISLDSNVLDKYSLLEKACKEFSKVKISYVGNNNIYSTRIIHPYSLFTKRTSCYIIAFCETRQEKRYFKLDRIRDITVLNETFTQPEIIYTLINNNQFYYFRKPYKAIIYFNSNNNIHNKIVSHFKTDISIVSPNTYNITFFNSSSFIPKLLSLGLNFTIKSPAWLKDKLTYTLSKILSNNS